MIQENKVTLTQIKHYTDTHFLLYRKLYNTQKTFYEKQSLLSNRNRCKYISKVHCILYKSSTNGLAIGIAGQVKKLVCAYFKQSCCLMVRALAARVQFRGSGFKSRPGHITCLLVRCLSLKEWSRGINMGS